MHTDQIPKRNQETRSILLVQLLAVGIIKLDLFLGLDWEASVASLSTSNAPSASDSEIDKLWYYWDSNENIRGPFCLLQLCKWSTTRYFPPDMRIRSGLPHHLRSVSSYQSPESVHSSGRSVKRALCLSLGLVGVCSSSSDYHGFLKSLSFSRINSRWKKGLIFDVKLAVVPRVCKSWGKVVTGPYCWQEIDIEEWSDLAEPDTIDRLLIVRSSGSVRKLCDSELQNDLMFSFIAEQLALGKKVLGLGIYDFGKESNGYSIRIPAIHGWIGGYIVKALPEHGSCRQEVSTELQTKVRNLRIALGDLHLKHKSLSTELQCHLDTDAKNKTELLHLRGRSISQKIACSTAYLGLSVGSDSCSFHKLK
ncbi:hypothetical protein Vadar_009649 [Vaccinium darrowii]|uniref:Uncharacterized protein n=1 Tax=Vaccinium darrowii TaxID=229202 RepID=A0ACB7YKZ5_9ERIC|nr:hypothetical protein Vadar_009649 [Vaccinium darrowii]